MAIDSEGNGLTTRIQVHHPVLDDGVRVSNPDPLLLSPVPSILASNKNFVKQACNLGAIAEHQKNKD
jgi:hypothetical protein